LVPKRDARTLGTARSAFDVASLAVDSGVIAPGVSLDALSVADVADGGGSFTLRGVSVAYGREVVVEDVNMRIPRTRSRRSSARQAAASRRCSGASTA
jgi:hypothetical protein